MALVSKTIEVPKETDEIFQAVVGIVKATKKALADGFQPGADIPAIVAEAWADLPVAIQGIDQVPGELAASKAALIRSAGCAVGDLVEAVAA